MPEPEPIENIIDKCMYFIKDKVTFGVCVDSHIPLIVETKPEIPDDEPFICFYGTESKKDLGAAYALFEPIKARVMELTTVPPREKEFSGDQIKIMETIAHDLRSRACIEKDESKRNQIFAGAFKIYAGAALAAEISSLTFMVNLIMQEPPAFKNFTRVIDDANVLTVEKKRLFSHLLAGMAMCALMGQKSVNRFFTCTTAAIAYNPRDGIKLSHTLRALLLLYASNYMGLRGFEIDLDHKGCYSRFVSAEAALMFLDSDISRELPAVFYQLTKQVIVPMLLRKGRGAMLQQERNLILPTDWEQTMSNAAMFNTRDEQRAAVMSPSPVAKTSTVHVVNGRPVERICMHCGKGGAQAGKLFRCSRCLAVYYCSIECQHGDWENHKPACKRQGDAAR